MSNFTTVYTRRIKSTGEVIQEIEYHGLCNIEGLSKFTGCAPHNLYAIGEDRDDVGCTINAPTDDGDFDMLKIWPGCRVIKRENGSIEVWKDACQPVPYNDLELLSKKSIIT